MKAKTVNAKCRESKGGLAAFLPLYGVVSCPRAAAFLQRIEELEELDLRNIGRKQRLHLLHRSRGIHLALRKHTENLRNRLSVALARARLRNFSPLLASDRTAVVFRRYAYWRNYLMNRLLDLHYQIAKRDNDEPRMHRISLFKEKWDLADKGKLGKSEIGRRALALLRKLHFYEETRGRRRDPEFEHGLLEQIRTANPQSLNALSKAKAFREKRRGQGGMTEEKNRRADLMAYGIACELFGAEGKDSAGLHFLPTVRRAIRTWKDLLPKIAPDWKDDPRNFQKLLRECFFPFKPAGNWRGAAQNVYARAEKNTHSPL